MSTQAPEGEGQPSRNMTVGNTGGEFGPKSLHLGPLAAHVGVGNSHPPVWLKKRGRLTIKLQRTWKSKGRKQRGSGSVGNRKWEVESQELRSSLPF